MVDRGTIPAIQPGGPGTFIRFDPDEVLGAIRGKQVAADQAPVPPKAPTTLSGPAPYWKRNLDKGKDK